MAILIIIILGMFGFLEWAFGSIILILLDGLICTLIEDITVNQPAVISVGEATSGKYGIHSGIFTDYISVDIAFIWFIGLIIYKLFKKIKS